MKTILILLLVLWGCIWAQSSQELIKTEAPNVYVDCDDCDVN